MRIAYCTNVRLPNERAHGHQIARVCDAIVQLGHDVHIFAPYRRNSVQEDFWAYHEVDPRVQLTHIPSFDGIAFPFTPGVLGLRLTTWSYLRKLPLFLHGEQFDLLYTRTPEILSMLLSVGIPVVLELHKLPRRNRTLFIENCKSCVHVICLTSLMKRELTQWGIDKRKISVEGDAVDIRRFHHLPDRDKAREEWGIEKEEYVVGYAGSLRTMGLSKGVEQITEAVRKLHSEGRTISALIAGGPESEGRKLQGDPNVQYVGQLPLQEVPKVYAASDLLVYPAPKTSHPYFVRDTSPLKLFEYMAARCPMVVADIPPVWDVLDEDAAFFYQPGDIQDLASRIESAMDTPAEAQAKAERAHQLVQDHTWLKRMERILSSISS